MSYELSLNSSCQLLLTINLPIGLNNIQLKLIDHSRNESVINSNQYTITDNVLTYTIPSSLYNIEGNFGYYVVATGYESEHIDINAHLCAPINGCQQIEITSGEYSLCLRATVRTTYSTEEQLTGETWIDDKPIYRKVINFGQCPNNKSKYVDSGLINTSVRIIDIRGFAYNSSGTYQNPIPNNSSSFALQPTNKLLINCVGDWSSFYGYAILEYTKTTD